MSFTESAILEVHREKLVALRKALHSRPELSGSESGTASAIEDFIALLNPEVSQGGIGGHGVLFAFKGSEPGPTVMFRCELDALPIEEVNEFAYRSKNPGASHKCGHDGHMAAICALAILISERRPKCGRVILLFQGEEETGQGAAAMMKDPKFAPFRPDFAFSLHNLPGHPLGRVLVKPGSFCCASRGLIITLQGKTSHAAHPEDGISPMQAMCAIMTELSDLSRPSASGDAFRLATIVHCSLGEKTFGTSPGLGQIFVTLRTETDTTMDQLIDETISLIKGSASRNRLDVTFDWRDIFSATENHPQATELIVKCARKRGAETIIMERPHRWSEDFGQFTAQCKGAMFALGAGEQTPQLHNPDYDYPDALIFESALLFYDIAQEILNRP